MNNKTFIDEIAKKLDTDAEEAQLQVDILVGMLHTLLTDGSSLNVKDFGTFSPKTKAERKMYNPSTRTFNIVPARTTIGFKMNTALKDKVNA